MSVAGFSVIVLEQGPYLREKDFSHDEIKYSQLRALTNDPKIQPVTYRKSEAEPPKRIKAIEYGRQVGGGSVHFTANYWRFHESDFRERSLFGAVAGADLQDWPITYADLEMYYTNAEWDMGISGLAGANPFEGPPRDLTRFRRCRRNPQACCSSVRRKSSDYIPFLRL